jgi:hypothetical protein
MIPPQQPALGQVAELRQVSKGEHSALYRELPKGRDSPSRLKPTS